jgi:alpha-soluble NSF attachment protein
MFVVLLFSCSRNVSNFQLPSSGSNKVEDAIECYHRAGNMFKMGKNWQQAGAAFCAAGNLHAQAGSRHDAATNYVDASNCFKKVSQKTF